MRRSRYKHYWYGLILTQLKQYGRVKKSDSPQSRQFIEAVEKAKADTAQMDNGELRIKAMDMLYFQNTATIEGVAQALHYSRGTILSWSSDFINKVGRNAGY